MPPSAHAPHVPETQQDPAAQLESLVQLGGGGGGQVVQPPPMQQPIVQSASVVHGPVYARSAHWARWLFVDMSWNGSQKAGQLGSTPPETAVASGRTAAIQICARLQLLVVVKYGVMGLSVG